MAERQYVDIDPAVLTAITTTNHGKTRAQQKKARRDAARTGSKMAYDMPSDVIEAIREIANEESVSQSNLVAVILANWINAYRTGDVQINEAQRIPARHLRWLWRIEIPDIGASV